MFDILDSLTSSSAVDIEYSPDEIIASSATSESFIILEVSTFTTSFINVPSFDFIDFTSAPAPSGISVIDSNNFIPLYVVLSFIRYNSEIIEAASAFKAARDAVS